MRMRERQNTEVAAGDGRESDVEAEGRSRGLGSRGYEKSRVREAPAGGVVDGTSLSPFS